MVTLRSRSASVTLSANVTVPSGSTSASFPITTKKVKAAGAADLTATYAGRQVSTTLAVTRR